MKSSTTGQNGGVRVIKEYPFAQVKEKLLLEGEIPPDAIDEAISEFRKYLLLVALGHKSVAMVSREVDTVWHTFILFTKDYAQFSKEAFGFFLHHQPSIPSQPIDPSSRQRFVDAYHQEFGDLPKIWAAGLESDPKGDGCCGEDCAPDPPCSGEPDPTVVSRENSALS